jgi:hypothetical protein
LLFLFLLPLGARCFGTVAITTTSLPNGTVGTAYSAVVKASGGCSRYQWAIASGALPAGVTAKASSTTTSLNLTGTPTSAATYCFTVKITACGRGTSQVAYKVAIQGTANHVVDLSWKASTSKRRYWLQPLSSSGWSDLEKDQCKPDRINPVCGLRRGEWQHILLRGDSSRYLRA